jgi:hypothetical protein
MTAVLPAPDPPRPNAPTAIAGGRTRVADAIVPRIADTILSDPPLCPVTFTTIWASRAVPRSLCETRVHTSQPITRTTAGPCQSLPQRVRCVRITGGTHLLAEQPRSLGRCSPFGRREFLHRGWRPRERSPTALAGYSHRRDRRGSMAFRTAASRRAGGLAGRGRPPTVVRYATPGFPKTAKSWPANRGNLFAGGAGGTAKLVQQTSVTPNARATTSPAGLAAPRPAPRNSPFSSRAQAGEFSPPPRSGRPGNRRSPPISA